MEAPPTAAAEDGNTPQLAAAVQEAMDGQQGAGTMAPNGEADREKGNGVGGRLAQGGAKPAVDSQAAVASSPQGLGLGVSEEGVAGRSSPGAGVAVTLKGTAATLFKLVELRDRRYLFRLYRRCIVGRQAVQALLQARIVETRLEGVHVCHAMVMSGGEGVAPPSLPPLACRRAPRLFPLGTVPPRQLPSPIPRCHTHPTARRRPAPPCQRLAAVQGRLDVLPVVT